MAMAGTYQRKQNIRYLTGYLFLVVLLFGLLLVNLVLGSASLTPLDAIRILLQGHSDDTSGKIIWVIRLPRLIGAGLLGGALSVSGYLLQTFFGNPIAGPFVLGISSGAKLFVTLVLILFLQAGITVTSGHLVAAAFAGSLLSMFFILLVSRRVSKMSILIICGVMIGYICSAITDFIVTFADDANIVNLHNWSLGSFSGISWDNNRMIIAVVFFCMIWVIFLIKPMSAFQLGEEYARNAGVSVRRFRVELILVSSLLSACVTAFAGPVSFVGIAVPQLMKGIFHTAKPLHMIPACFLGGASFCLLCDLIARTAFAPTELSIGSVTAVFGAPVVLFVMLNRKRERFS